MTDTVFLQVIGTFSLALVGAVTLFAAAKRAAWCSYGRWIAGVLGASQFAFVANRVLYLTHYIDAHTAVLLSGLTGVVVAIIQVNLVVLHWDWHRRGLASPREHRHVEGRAA